jgi:diguanylate cyclase (GGDEF)-like protein
VAEEPARTDHPENGAILGRQRDGAAAAARLETTSTLAESEQSLAEIDQTSSDSDQTGSDGDQTSSDRDQATADREQAAADRDQAASDDDFAAGVNPVAYASSRDVRRQSTREREQTALARMQTAVERDAIAHARDVAAHARDLAGEARDRAMAKLEASTAKEDGARAVTGAEVVIRAGALRQRAARYRAQAAEHRAQAATDREAAARDRELGARDRLAALADRELLLGRLAAAETDPLTGTRTRKAGLEDLQREADRCERTGTPLSVAYVDVVGLKARNDSQGHSAGDQLLVDVASYMRAHLRSYDHITRVGGDEFVCAMPNMTLADARVRFCQIACALAGAPEPHAIRTGFAELAPGESSAELIARADRELTATRRD